MAANARAQRLRARLAVAGAAARHARGAVPWERSDRLLTSDRLVVYPAVAVLLFMVVWAIALGSAFPLPDFLSRWTSGRLVLDGQVDGLYDPVVQSSVQAAVGSERLSWFVSPPFVAVLFAPFALLEYPLAAGLWTVVSVALVALSFYLLRDVHAAFDRLAGWPGILIAVSCQPMLELIGAGQDTAIVLVAFAAAARLLSRRRDLAAGLVLGLGLIKPQHMWLVPLVFVLFQRWRVLGAFAASVVFIVAGSTALLGDAAWNAWLAALASPLYRTEVVAGQAYKNTTIHGFLEYLTPGEGWAASALWLVVSVALLVITAQRSRHLVALGLPVFLVTVTPWVTMLTTPHAMVYDAVVLIPGAAWLVYERPTARVRVLVAVGYVLLLLAPLLRAVALSVPLVSFAGAPWVVPVLLCLWWVMVPPQQDSAPAQ